MGVDLYLVKKDFIIGATITYSDEPKEEVSQPPGEGKDFLKFDYYDPEDDDDIHTEYEFKKGEIIRTHEGYIESLHIPPNLLDAIFFNDHGSDIYFPKSLFSISDEYYSKIVNMDALDKYYELEPKIEKLSAELKLYEEAERLSLLDLDSKKKELEETEILSQDKFEEFQKFMDKHVEQYIENSKKIIQTKEVLESLNREMEYYYSRLTYSGDADLRDWQIPDIYSGEQDGLKAIHKKAGLTQKQMATYLLKQLDNLDLMKKKSREAYEIHCDNPNEQNEKENAQAEKIVHAQKSLIKYAAESLFGVRFEDRILDSCFRECLQILESEDTPYVIMRDDDLSMFAVSYYLKGVFPNLKKLDVGRDTWIMATPAAQQNAIKMLEERKEKQLGELNEIKDLLKELSKSADMQKGLEARGPKL